MMRGDFRKNDDKKLSTGDLATLSALQDDYASLRRFIQRGDTTNASARIDIVVNELAQLKTALPTMIISVSK